MAGRQGLDAEHIKQRPLQMTFIDQRQQILIDHMLAARNIDDIAAHLQLLQIFAVQYAFGIGRKRQNIDQRSEEHTSELQSLMRNSYAVFCLKKKITQNTNKPSTNLQNTFRQL